MPGPAPTTTAVPTARSWGRPILAAVAVTAAVAALGRWVVTASSALQQWDQDVVEEAVQVTRGHPPMGSLLLIWQSVAQPWVLQTALVLTCLAVARWPPARGPGPDSRADVRARAAFVVMLTLVGWALGALAKIVVGRPRPVVPDPVTVLTGLSFPSGHATNAGLTAALLLVLLWPWLTPRARLTATATAAVVVLLTCADRVLLGVHYPTDVLAGLLLGLGTAVAGYAAWRPPPEP